MTKTALLLAPLLLLLAACAGTSGPKPERDPEIEAQFAAERDAAARQAKTSFEQVLILIDKSLDKYIQAKLRAGSPTHDHLAVSLEKYLKKLVSDNFDALVRTAADPTFPANRAIAVGGLGFAHRQEALDPLLNALKAEDPQVVTNAGLSLGVLVNAHTPPAALGDIVENDKLDRLARLSASWALMQLQPKLYEPESVLPIWLRLLARPIGDVDPEILVHALRGVGLLRKPELAPQVERFVSHPVPLVRAATALSLGFLGNRASHVALLALIGPAETNANVRLYARKALETLAGGLTRGYDVDEWRKVFGSDGK